MLPEVVRIFQGFLLFCHSDFEVYLDLFKKKKKNYSNG